MGEHRFRCGDTARIEGTDYDIEVAYADYERGGASWFGWPEGMVEIGRLVLVRACSEEEHRKSVAEAVDRTCSHGTDHRRAVIARLYRPRAYWQGQVELQRERVMQASEQLRHCEAALLRVQAGPDDVEPLPASSPAQEGAPTP